MWRQGDVFIQHTAEIPADVRQSPVPHGVLVHGEMTGHSHRIADLTAAQLYFGRSPGEIFLEVIAPRATVVHEEHGPITLERGTYRAWRQREYSPEAIRAVSD